MQRNLYLYRIFVLTIDTGLTWPVKFLLMMQYLTWQDVLLLQSIYQVLIVALEVPSGLFSDRFGRRPTLVIAATASIASLAFFGIATRFSAFLVANLCWALAASFLSGTDNTFHFDSLEALARQGEFQKREAAIQKQNLLLQATLAFIGGILGTFAYRYAFFLAAFLAVVALIAAVRMREPPRFHRANELELFRHIGEIAQNLRKPVVAWFFAFAALSTVLDYLPYQYYQPYIDLLKNTGMVKIGTTPILTGTHAALTMFIGAFAVGLTPRLIRLLPQSRVLLLASWIHFALIFLCAAFLHPLIAGLLIFREIPNGIKNGILAPTLLPLLPQRHRATILSLITFGARLAVAGAFFALAFIHEGTVRMQMTRQLAWAGFILLAGWLALALSTPKELSNR